MNIHEQCCFISYLFHYPLWFKLVRIGTYVNQYKIEKLKKQIKLEIIYAEYVSPHHTKLVSDSLSLVLICRKNV